MVEDPSPPESKARERILQSAINLFAQKGYDGVSVREIVERAGVTKPVLYYYFGNKEGLYQTLVEGALDTYRRVLETAASRGGTTREQLVEMVRLQLDLCRDNEALLRLLYAALINPPPEIPPYDFGRFYQATLTVLKEILSRGIEGGELEGEKTEEAALVLLGIVNIYAMSQVFGKSVKVSYEAVERTVEILYHGMKRTDGERG